MHLLPARLPAADLLHQGQMGTLAYNISNV